MPQKDTTKPDTSIVTSQKLRALGWEIILHPAYSPDNAAAIFVSKTSDLAYEELVLREIC